MLRLFARRSSPGLAVLFVVLAVGFSGGCASGPNKADPYEKTNRFIYNLNEGIDHVALKPAADLYTKVIPQPIRTGIGNGFDNLVYFNVIVNDLLQTRWQQALGDSGRMAVNSTVGIAGIFDWATPIGLPAHKNDFGVTLGKWGAKPGPYIVLPLFGPSTARDAPGLLVEYLATPTTYLFLPAKIYIPLDATNLLDARSRGDVLVQFRNNTALDPYVFTRDAYLQYREGRIHDESPATTAPTTEPSIYDQDMDSGPATAPAGTRPATEPAR